MSRKDPRKQAARERRKRKRTYERIRNLSYAMQPHVVQAWVGNYSLLNQPTGQGRGQIQGSWTTVSKQARLSIEARARERRNIERP
jgi:hypothetical protein